MKGRTGGRRRRKEGKERAPGTPLTYPLKNEGRREGQEVSRSWESVEEERERKEEGGRGSRDGRKEMK